MALYLFKTPNGKFSFGGQVPPVLAAEASSIAYLETAMQYGPRLARMQAEREGGVYCDLSWDTSAAALQFAKAQGYDNISVAGE